MAGRNQDRRPSIIAETARLRIRPLEQGDAAFVLKLTSDPDFVANIGDKGLRIEEDARRFIAEGPWTRRREEGYGQFLVELKETREPVGICGLLYREALDVTDVGFAIDAGHRRKGIALEAAKAVMKYGREELHVEEIVGLTSPGNNASIRVLEALGMQFDRKMQMPGYEETALYR